jgi:protein arginine N-methyltransferase 1
VSEIELHRKLLGDGVRNRALHEALKRAIKPGCRVVDIGAGTGFLSFLARQLGAKHCTLIEYSGALELAKKLARDNHVTGLAFVQAHSIEVKKPPKAEVVISETLGNFALEEHLLETLVDARRFLAARGTLIPCGLKQLVAPVLGPRIQAELDVWPKVGFGWKVSAAREVSLNNMYVRTLQPADLGGDLKLAQCWDRLDFAPAGEPPASVRRATLRWTELPRETVYGFALWWEAELVPGVVISTSPLAPATHWEQVYLPLLKPLEISERRSLELSLTSDTRLKSGVRVAWQTRLLEGARVLSDQRQDMSRGRL